MKLKYVTDGKRHLVCVPYSISNLHEMAKQLDINKCFFHKNHYDIPAKRIEEIEKKCMMVNKETIVEIIRSPKYAETILSDEIRPGGASPPDRFMEQEMKYNGFGQ